jgi:thiamine biosynthesis lipoprotein
MGSLFEIYLAGGDALHLEYVGRAALERVLWWEGRLNHFDLQSELSRLNREAFLRPVEVAPDMMRLLLQARRLSERTEGAFDVTVGKLVEVWGLFRKGTLQGERGEPPSSQVLAQIVQEIGWHAVQLEEERGTVQFLTPSVRLHLAALGKGFAVDVVAEYLREAGITDALIQSGYSSVRALGSPPEGQGWRVGIAHPFNEEQTLRQVNLSGQSLSTSGSAESLITPEGRAIPHLFDPRSGEVVELRGSVSVVAPTALEAEALSTAFFVQGVAWSAAFCARNPQYGGLFALCERANQTPCLHHLGRESEKWA